MTVENGCRSDLYRASDKDADAINQLLAIVQLLYSGRRSHERAQFISAPHLTITRNIV